MLRLEKTSILFLVYTIFVVVFWCVQNLLDIKTGSFAYMYQFAYSLIPIMGAVGGVMYAADWGGYKSMVGKMLMFLSAGLLFSGAAQITWATYYNALLGIEIPYPAVPDYFYILAYVMFILAMIYMSRIIGSTRALAQSSRRNLSIFAMIIIASVFLNYHVTQTTKGFFIIPHVAQITPKLIFDLIYNVMDTVLSTFALFMLVFSYRKLGGRFKSSILMFVCGFFILYMADFAYSYATQFNVYYNGHFVDLLYPISYAFITIALNNFSANFLSRAA